ncbi:MAG: phosphatase PAP2 family protein [Tannerellaceae bacterium]|nr:phosphatase PAP2 family protein [Tannerellaceae bacterium]
MNLQLSLPSRKESILVIIISILYLALTGIFIGFRSEHFLMMGTFWVLFFTNDFTRKLGVALIPFMLFGASYDWMRVYHNYMVNSIDIEDLYNMEKSLFGINLNGERLIPCEYFALFNHPVVDFLAGIFYLGWVPIPMAFVVYLYLKKEKEIYLHFAIVFLLTNLIGFAGYYIHPAAPPWYAMNYGFEAILDTPGNMGGLERFDLLVGIPVFDSIYGRNANVFAAIPSLHSAYLVVVFFYAIKRKSNPVLIGIVTLFMFGIWFTAVYSCHHYLIDVILGALCAVLGIFVFEKGLINLKGFKSFFDRYYNYIK